MDVLNPMLLCTPRGSFASCCDATAWLRWNAHELGGATRSPQRSAQITVRDVAWSSARLVPSLRTRWGVRTLRRSGYVDRGVSVNVCRVDHTSGSSLV